MKLKVWQIIVTICYLVTIPRLYYILNNLTEKNSPFTDYIIVMIWIILILCIVAEITMYLNRKNMLKTINDFLNKEIKIV